MYINIVESKYLIKVTQLIFRLIVQTIVFSESLMQRIRYIINDKLIHRTSIIRLGV